MDLIYLAITAIIAVLAWFLANFVGGPILEYRKLRSQIAHSLILYHNVDVEARERLREAERVYREQASAVMSCANAFIASPLLAMLHVIPSRDDFWEVKANLIGLSNGIGDPRAWNRNDERRETIRSILRIQT